MQFVNFIRIAAVAVVLAGGLATPVSAQPKLVENLFKLAIEAARQERGMEVEVGKMPVAKPPSGSAAAGSSSISLLYDTDLPYNDYRSGMQDPALKGVDLGQCQQLCEADNRCNAFTFNSKARVCFLKTAAATPERFKGAISGIKGDLDAMTAEADLSRALTRKEIAQLQQALLELGYDVGTPDGKVGKKTRNAIADFVAANPGVATANIDLALLAAVSGGSTAAPISPAGSDKTDPDTLAAKVAETSPAKTAIGVMGMPMHDGAYIIGFSDARGALVKGGYKAYDRSLGDFVKLLMLRGNPSFIEDKYLTGFFAGVLRFEDVAPYLDDIAIRGIKKRGFLDVDPSQWKGEDQFEREDSRLAFLAAYRDKIMAMVPELPIQLEMMRSVTYGDYNASTQQLPIRIDTSDFWPALGRVGLDAPLPASLPSNWALDEASARFVLDEKVAAEKRSEAEGRYLIPVSVSRVTLTGIRPSDHSIALELEAIGHKFFADQTMAQELGPIGVEKDVAETEKDDASAAHVVEQMSNEAVFKLLGLPLRDGAPVLGPATNASLTDTALPGGEEAYEAAVDKLGRLLLLLANPEWLDAPERTYLFVPLIGVKRAGRYLDSRPGVAPGGLALTTWNGETSFRREDSRKAFLAEFRNEILAMVPKLPLRLDFVRTIHYGEYNAATQSLAIGVDSDGPFRDFDRSSVDFVGPYSLPEQWEISEAKARELFKSSREVAKRETEDGAYHRPVFVGRVEVTAARPTENGAVFELAAVDITVYADQRLEQVLGTMPLPPDANLAQPQEQAAAAPAAPANGVPFDPLFVRMLVATERPEFGSADSFRRETFNIKREAELLSREPGRAPIEAWPPVIPLSLQSGKLHPTAGDLAKVDGWFESARQSIDKTATIVGFCGRDGKDPQCLLPHDAIKADGTLELSSLVEAALDRWHYGWHGLPEDANDIAGQQYPDSSGLIAMGVGNDVPGYVVLHADAAWYGIPAPKVTMLDAVVDVEIIGHQILGTSSGKGFVAVEIAPRAFRYLTEDEEWVTIPIEKAAPTAPAARYDVLGVKLGMPLAEAEKLIQASFDGRQVKRRDVTHKGKYDPILGPSVAFQSPVGVTMQLAGDEVVKLYFDALQADKPIIAVGRVVRFAENADRDADDKAAAAPVFSTVLEKYGQPDHEGEFNSSYDASLWAVDPVAKARIAKDGDRQTLCEVNSAMGTIYNDDGRFHSDMFKGDCSEVLAVWFGEGLVSVYLADTSAIVRLRAGYIARFNEEQAAKKAAQPQVKF